MKNKRLTFATKSVVQAATPQTSYLFVYYVLLAMMVSLGLAYL